MKKLFLLLIAAAVGTMSCFAQEDFVATLSHGTELSTFTGEDGLAQAYEAAVDGDVITLSPGVFVATDINKCITLRGAGCKPMLSNGYVPTQVIGTLNITVPAEFSSAPTLEGFEALGGVYLSRSGEKIAPVNFLKCRFNSDVYGRGVSLNATSCIFASSLYASYYNNSNYLNTTLNCYNCIIKYAYSDGLYTSSNSYAIGKITATNCILGYRNDLPRSVLVNCIVIDDWGYTLSSECLANNCVGMNHYYNDDNRNIFSNVYAPNTMLEGYKPYSSIFKTFADIGNLPYGETYELTDEAAAQYLGEDGTQVGVYGGTSPFNLSLTNPQITKFSVSSATENGQLKVKINVE